MPKVLASVIIRQDRGRPQPRRPTVRYSRYSIDAELLQIPEDNRILFFRRDRAAFGFLSHFFPSPFSLDGEDWLTVEHYYQAQKSLDLAYRRAIRACVTAGQAKRCASTPNVDPNAKNNRHSWFAKHHKKPREDWYDVKRQIMRQADMAKYVQNPDLAALLLDCGDAEIIEDSLSDPFWGIGHDGTGGNWAGRIIMDVRGDLRAA